jgi:hypothetical protein
LPQCKKPCKEITKRLLCATLSYLLLPFFATVYHPENQLETKMKTLKALGMALVLALSLSMPAYADLDPGDNHTPGRSDPAAEGNEKATTKLPGTDTTGDSLAVDSDLDFTTIADILWGMASIY